MFNYNQVKIGLLVDININSPIIKFKHNKYLYIYYFKIILML